MGVSSTGLDSRLGEFGADDGAGVGCIILIVDNLICSLYLKTVRCRKYILLEGLLSWQDVSERLFVSVYYVRIRNIS